MLSRHPFLKLLIPLVGGILTLELWQCTVILSPDTLWYTGLFIILLLVSAILSLSVSGAARPALRALLVHMILFGLGFLSNLTRHYAFYQQIATISAYPYDAYTLEVRTLGQKKTRTIQYEARLLSIRARGTWYNTTSRVLVSFPEGEDPAFQPGTMFLVRNHPLQRPPSPLNPGEFDYAKYLERLGIAWTVYLQEDTYLTIGEYTTSSPLDWPLYLSQKADSVFRTYLKTDSSYGLVKAMLLGQRGDMSSDLLNAYIQAGAVHVLSVSGLHVTLLFALLALLTGNLRKSPWGRYLYLLIAIIFLVFYALMTGLSPSVVRASLMCFTFAISQVFQRKNQSLNTLILSAFFILVVDPQALFAVGFQLSYAAMLGIILLYPLLKDSIQIRFMLLRWLWQITLVGCTAQLFTLPISIYYFHQFPIYFWLVNPVVIVLTTVLMYGSIVLLATSLLSLSMLSRYIGWCLDLLAQLMNWVVSIPRKLPGYIVENLNLDLVEVLILSILLVMVYRLLEKRTYSTLKGVFLISILFVQYGIFKVVLDFRTSSLYFHAVPRHTVLSATRGQIGYILSDSSFQTDSSSYKAHIANFFVQRGITQVQFVPLAPVRSGQSQRIRWQAINIGLDTYHKPGEENWFVLRGRFFPQDTIQLPNKNPLYVVSPELGFKTRERWVKILKAKKLRYYLPAERGALQFP